MCSENIDPIVDEQLETGQTGRYHWAGHNTFEPCPQCGHEWHGLPCIASAALIGYQPCGCTYEHEMP
jgi:hypothetical protein